MKKIIFLMTTLAIAFESSGGLFGPSTFEECLLDNMKNAKTDNAVSAVKSACAMKFPIKDTKEKSSSVKLCKLYWDGWKFVEGGKPNNDYDKLIISYLGAPSLELSLPRSMINYLEYDKAKSKELDTTTKFGRFFGEHYGHIKILCAFK